MHATSHIEQFANSGIRYVSLGIEAIGYRAFRAAASNRVWLPKLKNPRMTNSTSIKQ